MAGVFSVSSPSAHINASPLLAAVLNKAGWTRPDTFLKEDKTAAVLAELRRPSGTSDLKRSTRTSADQPAQQTSGMSAFSKTPVSELLVRPLFAVSSVS